MIVKKFLGNGVALNIEITTEMVTDQFDPETVVNNMVPGHKLLFGKTIYFVCADNNAEHQLWKEYRDQGFPEKQEASFVTLIGNIVDNQVWMRLSYRKINGKIICFYNLTGSYAIWPMAEKFFEVAAPRIPKTDATNFHNALFATKKRK